MRKYRTVWISDVHLGTLASKHKELLNFLDNMKCDTLFLCGDIIDMWRLKAGWFWPKEHNKVFMELMKLDAKGTRVIYIPGNHDEGFKQFIGLNFGGIELKKEHIHTLANGKRILVTHGDEFDNDMVKYAWATKYYIFTLWFNNCYNWLRRIFGKKYRSLSMLYLTSERQEDISDNYAQMVIAGVKYRNENLSGVVVGHLHHPSIKEIDGFIYANDGDWFTNTTALVEDKHGQLKIINVGAKKS